MKYEGTCDVCGEVLTGELSPGYDVAVDKDDRLYTWTRHYATAPEGANPDCARYFSVVFLVIPDQTNTKE